MPEVNITSVEKISDTLARIVAELSQDIDQGFVSFQKNRNDTWTNMVTDNGEKDFALAPKKTVIVGETYTLDNSIGMYDNNNISQRRAGTTNWVLTSICLVVALTSTSHSITCRFVISSCLS